MNSQVYFENIRERIVEALDQCEFDLKIAVAWFTDKKLLSKVEELSKRGVKVKIIIYDDHINQKTLFENLYYNKAEIFLSRKLMHNKFCVIDDKTVINGSYNWTHNASTNNENIQITFDNTVLAEKFENEFHILQRKCSSIDFFFKYTLDNILKEESIFYSQYENLKNKYTFPYFINITDFEVDKYPRKSKLKKGFALIVNEEDELNYYRYIYYLEKDFNFSQIKKVTEKNFYFPNIFEIIIGFENTKEVVIPAKQPFYIVEKSFTKYLGNRVGKIDNFGNILIEDITFSQKYSNGFYKIEYRYGRTKILDSELNEIPIKGHFAKLIPDLGIVSYEYNNKYNFGLSDFDENVLVKYEYDDYEVIGDNCVEFWEYPCCYSKYFEKKNDVVVWSYNSFHSSRDKTNCHKKHFFNINSKNMVISSTIYNGKPEANYFFLSDDDYFFKELYLEFEYKYVRLNTFLKIKADFKDLPKYESQKEYAKYLYDIYKVQIDREGKWEMETKNEGCYIATMIFQDYNHPKVLSLRALRDNILLKYRFGKWFVNKYYKYSPKFVERFKDTIWVKPIGLVIKLLVFLLESFFGFKR